MTSVESWWLDLMFNRVLLSVGRLSSALTVYVGIKIDCDDNMYVTGFMASNRGFIRKYDRDGNILWTKADFQDQVQ